MAHRSCWQGQSYAHPFVRDLSKHFRQGCGQTQPCNAWFSEDSTFSFPAAVRRMGNVRLGFSGMPSAKQPLVRKSKTVPRAAVKSSSAVGSENLRTLAGRSPRLLAVLRFLFGHAAGSLSFQDLRVRPILASHRNTISEKSFFLPKDRFAG